jgi:N-acylneuraminate cytidylyltransferase
MTILGLIPARSGSKGVPNKNIRQIAGKPLIAWSIESALASKRLDRIIVSTDSKQYAKIAREYGADVLIRPGYLADDNASTLDVMIHALKAIPADIFVLLQPTSPIRRPGLIDECISEFLDGGFDTLATGYICTAVEFGKNPQRRQDIKGFFYDDGNIYINRAEQILAGDRYGEKICRKLISRYENCEIDDRFDFWLCEKILEDVELHNEQKAFHNLHQMNNYAVVIQN